MMILLCRNKVKDFDHWKSIFDGNTDGSDRSGLKLIQMWRDVDDPNNAFFSFEVEDRARAEAFMADPASAELGEIAGVIEGECHFLEEV